MDRSYTALDKDDQELCERYAKNIDQAVREAFPSIPANFKLKPVTIRKTRGCGMFYDLKVPLPDGKFATVSFHTGGYPVPGQKPADPRFNVDSTPSSSENE